MSGGGTSASRVVAIDGPAGSGKSTVARAVAERLGTAHLDTGAMYRAVAFAALRDGLDLDDGDGLDALAKRVELNLEGGRVLVDGDDATEAIRGQAVSQAVSPVATNAGVREAMVRRQREWAEAHGGGVIEGRDIGTAVFPDAGVKVFLTASPEERARRRAAETDGIDQATLAAQIAERDERDATRAVDPMKPADDSLLLDTTEMDLEAVIQAVLDAADAAAPPASPTRAASEAERAPDWSPPGAGRPTSVFVRPTQPVIEAPQLGLGARAGYQLISATARGIGKVGYRTEIVGRERLPRTGPYILAPSHRSGMDFLFAAMVTRRRVRWMAKESLWKHPALGSFVDIMGGFRVNRGTADRHSLRVAEAILSDGQPLVVFPEGTRRRGELVEDLFDGVAWLSSRQRVPVVPVGMAGTEEAMATGSKLPRPGKIVIWVGEPLWPDVPPTGRIPRSQVRAFTNRMLPELQDAFDQATARRTQRRSG
ncbi:MAG: (d)CMP kinase [Microthrixaceae bacterium]